MRDHKNRHRVVVTGIGAISPLGSSVSQFWQGLKNGESGIRRITLFDPSDLPCQIAGEIPDFNPEDYMERKEARRIPRSGQIGLAAAMQAVGDAGFVEGVRNSERCGVCFGTAIGGLDWAADSIQIFHERGLSRVNPFTIPGGIPNLSSFLIARQFKVLGPNSTVTTACATGTQSIGEGLEWIRHGRADVVISGGTEAIIKDFTIAGFCAMRALPTSFNDRPQSASRPFDAKREGFIFSEGAASLVIESLEHALSRGAHIYAEIIGQASSSDALHIAQPDPDAKGPARAMRWALDDANIQPQDVAYINAHGSSTPLNDPAETYAIKQVFGDHAYQMAISSTKSMIGHAMGATGALEAIACILALVNGWLPPTINYEEPDPDCDLDYVPNQARKQEIKFALSNSFGLGGQNACLIFKKYQPND